MSVTEMNGSSWSSATAGIGNIRSALASRALQASVPYFFGRLPRRSMWGSAGSRPHSERSTPNMRKASSSRPAIPNLQNASVSTSSDIERRPAASAEPQKRAISLARAVNVDVLIEQPFQLLASADVPVKSLHSHRRRYVIAGATCPGEDHRTRIHAAILFKADCFLRQISKIS